jgi:hypothetical protein
MKPSNPHFSPQAPEKDSVLDRGCVEDQPQRARSTYPLRLVEDDTAAIR